MIANLWEYQQKHFPDWEKYFDMPNKQNKRPPVFLKDMEDNNLLIDPTMEASQRYRIINMIPKKARHRWFRSMKSSQALVQSVFGNLAANGLLGSLLDLKNENGELLFGDYDVDFEKLTFEHIARNLGEHTPSSIDVFIPGGNQIVIESKFSESEFGCCSQPQLTKKKPNYEVDYCNGTYTRQRGREKRCSLSEKLIRYWEYVPKAFKWGNDIDLDPCPLFRNYQLVRNIMVACLLPNGEFSMDNGHVIVIYDSRNPSFHEGGKCHISFEETKNSLRLPSLLKKCSWQTIINHLRGKDILPWLTEQLREKYGL